MLDRDLFRNFNEEFFKQYCKNRNVSFENILAIKNLDKECRTIITKIEKNNQQSKQYANQFKQTKDKNIKKQVQELKKQNDELKAELESKTNQLQDLLLALPNIPSKNVPFGNSEKDNIEQKQFLAPTNFNFIPKAHWDLMVDLDLVDLQASQEISGTRYIIYKGLGAKLIRALIQYTIDCNTKNGYTEYVLPVIINEQALYDTGQLPKFKEDLYKLENEQKYLSPTAEVQLTNLYANKIIDTSLLPLKLTANSACFRSEAGSAGRDTRGVIRQHQFYKTELVKICMPENSAEELESLTKDAEYILESLKLPYRRVLLCSNDMGFSATQTYDLEVWLPSYNTYKEISSCSNCSNFQARRAKIRTRDKNNKIIYAHTLNGSSLAIDRLFAAIIENCQQADGRIKIPDVLVKYMGCAEIKK